MVSKSCYVFIDSSNLFYGGKGRLGWKVDYEKLANYLRKKYSATKIFYYSGINTYGYNPKLLSTQPYPINQCIDYVSHSLLGANKVEKKYINNDLARVRFLKKIQEFGYILRLKPIKFIKSFDGTLKIKANCDVDITLDMIRLRGKFQRAVLLSGDGDFEILLRYLKEKGKEVVIIANAQNTAWIYKQNYSKSLKNFEEIREGLI